MNTTLVSDDLLVWGLLRLAPIMYTFEITDIMFTIKSLKAPSSSFDITKYLSFTSGSTRSAAQACNCAQ